jgi:MFS family permease
MSDTPTPIAVGNGLDPFARRHFPRNFSMIVLENAVFVVAITMVGGTTVLPTLVTRLGGSAFLVGLLATCQSAGWLLPQILGAGLIAGKNRILPSLMAPLYMGRPMILLMAGIIAAFGARSPALLLTALYVSLLVFWATDGVASSVWFDLVAKCIQPDRRGRLFGLAQVGGGLGGMAVGTLVAVVLGSPALGFPGGYALLFLMSGVLFMLNLVPFFAMREPVGEPAARPAGPRPKLHLGSALARIIRTDRAFVRLITARLLLGAGMAAFPFYILFMDRELSVSAERLGLFTSAQVFGGLVGGLAIGWIADHRGPRSVIRLSALVCAVIPGIALLMGPLRAALGDGLVAVGVVLFVILGAVSATNMIGFMNYLLDIAPLDKRIVYVGLFNTLAGAVLVVPPFLGWLLQAASFTAVFAIAIAASLGSFIVSLGMRQPARPR